MGLVCGRPSRPTFESVEAAAQREQREAEEQPPSPLPTRLQPPPQPPATGAKATEGSSVTFHSFTPLPTPAKGPASAAATPASAAPRNLFGAADAGACGRRGRAPRRRCCGRRRRRRRGRAGRSLPCPPP